MLLTQAEDIGDHVCGLLRIENEVRHRRVYAIVDDLALRIAQIGRRRRGRAKREAGGKDR